MGEIIGRFHPLIVHLPIGMLILAFIIELASRKQHHLRYVMPFVLRVTIFFSVLAWFTGWIMPKEGEFDERLVSLHFWFALAVTLVTMLLYYLNQRSDTKLGSYYFPLFVINMILLTLAGHYGGSLTHGEDFLTKKKEDTQTRKAADVNSLVVYDQIVQPILKKRCFSCHNAGKKKGGLIMSTLEGLEIGGDEGKILIKGNADASPLYSRMLLPMEDEKHMPPKGKKGPNENELKLIAWWINQGADYKIRVGETERSEEIQSILAGYGQAVSQLDATGLEAVTEDQIAKFAQKGISVQSLSADSPFAIANLSRNTKLKKSQLKQLKSVAKNITELDLSFTNVDDGMLSTIASFKNLQKLKLQKSKISSKGLKHLTKLKHLSSLNLYGTQVDNAALEHLNKMPALSALYIWQTDIKKEALEEYKLSNPLVDISHEMDNSLFGDARLKPPLINAEKDIFEDTLRVNLDLNFKNVDLYYTTDGTVPDSNALKYTAPFLIDQTSIVKAVSIKTGWQTSELAEAVYTKVGHSIAAIQLKKQPNDKYKAKGAKSLFDFEKGTTSFVDGKWLGYEGEDLIATIDLGEQKKVNSIVVSALENTGSYIFFPKQLSVSSSSDGNSFALVETLDIPIAEGPTEPSIKSFYLPTGAIDARYLKVHVAGTLKNPPWHAAPGAKNWIFVDEILVD